MGGTGGRKGQEIPGNRNAVQFHEAVFFLSTGFVFDLNDVRGAAEFPDNGQRADRAGQAGVDHEAVVLGLYAQDRLGNTEKALYNTDGKLFADNLSILYQNNSVTIYEVPAIEGEGAE